MNLIERKHHYDEHDYIISNFRQLQYCYIESLLKNCIEYLSRFNFDKTGLKIIKLKNGFQFETRFLLNHLERKLSSFCF